MKTPKFGRTSWLKVAWVWKRSVDLSTFMFPYLVSTTYLFLFIEAYSYRGFISKFFGVNSVVFSFLTLAVGCVVLLGKRQLSHRHDLIDDVFRINKLLVPVIISIYLIVSVEEYQHFPNYVFATHHLQPIQFRYIMLFNVVLLIVGALRPYQARLLSLIKKYHSPEHLLTLAILVPLFWMSLMNLLSLSQGFVQNAIYFIEHPISSFDEKLQYRLPDYAFFAFIKNHTEERATIAVPPQRPPWLTSGNVGYVRYFLYPRKVVSEAETANFSLTNSADYIMISKGEWAVSDDTMYGWPKATVSAERIWYFNRETNQVVESTETVFDPTLPGNNFKWGLIKVRK